MSAFAKDGKVISSQGKSKTTTVKTKDDPYIGKYIYAIQKIEGEYKLYEGYPREELIDGFYMCEVFDRDKNKSNDFFMHPIHKSKIKIDRFKI